MTDNILLLTSFTVFNDDVSKTDNTAKVTFIDRQCTLKVLTVNYVWLTVFISMDRLTKFCMLY